MDDAGRVRWETLSSFELVLVDDVESVGQWESMAAEFKFLNFHGFTAMQTYIFWFALTLLGKVFGAGIICFAIYRSLFSNFFDFGDLVGSSGALFSVGLFVSLFLVSGLDSSVLFLAVGATIALCCSLPLQEFVFSGRFGFFVIGLTVASLPLDPITSFWRRGHFFTHLWKNTLFQYFCPVSKWCAQRYCLFEGNLGHFLRFSTRTTRKRFLWLGLVTSLGLCSAGFPVPDVFSGYFFVHDGGPSFTNSTFGSPPEDPDAGFKMFLMDEGDFFSRNLSPLREEPNGSLENLSDIDGTCAVTTRQKQQAESNFSIAQLGDIVGSRHYISTFRENLPAELHDFGSIHVTTAGASEDAQCVSTSFGAIRFSQDAGTHSVGFAKCKVEKLQTFATQFSTSSNTGVVSVTLPLSSDDSYTALGEEMVQPFTEPVPPASTDAALPHLVGDKGYNSVPEQATPYFGVAGFNMFLMDEGDLFSRSLSPLREEPNGSLKNLSDINGTCAVTTRQKQQAELNFSIAQLGENLQAELHDFGSFHVTTAAIGSAGFLNNPFLTASATEDAQCVSTSFGATRFSQDTGTHSAGFAKCKVEKLQTFVTQFSTSSITGVVSDTLPLSSDDSYTALGGEMVQPFTEPVPPASTDAALPHLVGDKGCNSVPEQATPFSAEVSGFVNPVASSISMSYFGDGSYAGEANAEVASQCALNVPIGRAGFLNKPFLTASATEVAQCVSTSGGAISFSQGTGTHSVGPVTCKVEKLQAFVTQLSTSSNTDVVRVTLPLSSDGYYTAPGGEMAQPFAEPVPPASTDAAMPHLVGDKGYNIVPEQATSFSAAVRGSVDPVATSISMSYFGDGSYAGDVNTEVASQCALNVYVGPAGFLNNPFLTASAYEDAQCVSTSVGATSFSQGTDTHSVGSVTSHRLRSCKHVVTQFSTSSNL